MIFPTPGEHPALVLLDVCQPISASDMPPVRLQPWQAMAADMLAHARARGWCILHALPPKPLPGQGRWRTVEALRPRPDERVFHRDAPSAFSDSMFAKALAEGLAGPLVVIGGSPDASALATTFDAICLQRDVVIVHDAICEAPRGLAGLMGLVDLGCRCGYGTVRTASMLQVVSGRIAFAVVRGGRVR